MSLTVPPTLLKQAQVGEMQQSNFLACIKDSLPYAWKLIEGLADRLAQDNASFVDNQVPPPDEKVRGQLLRVLASDAMRGALEWGVREPLWREACLPELSSRRALPSRWFELG